MNRILTLAAMCVASAILSVFLVPRDAQARREVTLFGKVEGPAPSGTAQLAFNFYDPDSHELVYRTVANARVEDGMYSAVVPAEGLDGEVFLMSVTAPEILPLGVQGPTPIVNVQLQAVSPGTAQTGHININGKVIATTSDAAGTGVSGIASSATGATKGVYGSATSTSGWGGYFDGRGFFSGNVGIGTNSPSNALHLHGAGTDVAMRMSLTGGTNPFVFTYNNSSQMILTTGAQERFSFLANGRLGVGTVGPVSALHVIGSTAISGNLSKGSGTFLIDHPLDPQNQYLYHSFVESPDMMNVYNGVAKLDSRGEALVALPTYFETLNKDYRYQLTPIGGWAPVYVASKVKDNAFRISGGKAGMEVSWQVTGVRQDPYANANRVIPEVEKPDWAKGTYLYPSVYGEPDSRREDVVYGNMLKRGKK